MMFNYIGLLILVFLCGVYVGGRLMAWKHNRERKDIKPEMSFQAQIENMGDLTNKTVIMKLPPGLAIDEVERIKDQLRGILDRKGADCIVTSTDVEVTA